MSFLDFRFNKNQKDDLWDGMKPPKLSLYTLYADFKWHRKLYKINNLNKKTKIAFYLLRVLQMVSYSKGWRKGEKYEI